MRISIIHPSRHRANLAIQVANNWLSKAKHPEDIEYIFSIDEDDIQRELYEQSGLHVLVSPNKSAIEAINNAVKQASNDLLIVVSDDFGCPQNWDVELLNRLKGQRDFLVKTADGLQNWIITLPIMDRVYYERFGYIYPPHIKHMFADTWMTHVGDLLDRKIIVNMLFLPDAMCYYSFGLLRPLLCPLLAYNDYAGKAYLEGVNCNFGLKDEEIKGVLRCDNGHINWLKSKGVNFELV